MDALKLKYKYFILTLGKRDYNAIRESSLKIKSNLSFSNIKMLKNDKMLFNGEIDDNTIIHYEYDSDGLSGRVYVNVDFRWNIEDSKLDAWYTLHVEYNNEYIRDILIEIGREQYLIRLVDKVLKQAAIDFKEYDEQVTVF